MLLPPFCPEDTNGPVSKQEMVRLLKLTRDRFETICEKYPLSLETKDGLRIWDHASGAADALTWCLDLLKRLEVEINDK